jgi:DNA-binding MarR family transcriptional regulator
MLQDGRPTQEDLDAILTWSTVRVARFLGQRLDDRLAAHGLNPVQFGVLAHLAVDAAMTQAELARSVLVRPQSIAPLLDELERRGLVVRTGERARGRRNPASLTPAGRALLESAWQVALDANDLADIGLSAGDGAELNRLLLRVIRATGGARARDGDALWST